MPRTRTGFTHEQRDIVLRRSYGTCELCNSHPVGHIHHRKPRRMGGVRGLGDEDVNRVSNALALCPSCHDQIESERRASRDLGRLVPPGAAPDLTPVYLPRYLGWVTLADDGEVHWHQSEDHARRWCDEHTT